MRNLLSSILLMAVSSLGIAANAPGLSGLPDGYRAIVVFAPNDTSAAPIQRTLTTTPGVTERDIAWFVVSPNATASNLDIRVSRGALANLHEADGLDAVLVGEDGRVVARQTESFDLHAFFDKIDALPAHPRATRSAK